MKSNMFMGVAAVALLAGAAQAQELKFAPGEDARFHWDSFEALKATDLKGRRC
jgi:alpha-glucoside transport system substrate-binding protein